MIPRVRGLDAADGAMLAVVLIWAANNVIIKAVLDELSPLAYVLARFLIVVLLLFAWLALRQRVRVPARADLPLVALAGLSGYAVYNAVFFVGLERTSAFSVALLISLGPVFTLFFATLLGIERAAPRQWLGVAVAVAGVAVFVGDKLRAGTPTSGDLLSLLAAAAFAVYSLSTRPLVGRYGAPVATAWSVLAGLLVMVPIALPAARRQDWVGLSPVAWASLLYASVLSMLVAYTVWAWAIERRGVGRTVPYLFLIPIVTGALAALLLGERFGPLKLGGAVLVLAGTALVRGLGAGGAAVLPRDPAPAGGPVVGGAAESPPVAGAQSTPAAR